MTGLAKCKALPMNEQYRLDEHGNITDVLDPIIWRGFVFSFRHQTSVTRYCQEWRCEELCITLRSVGAFWTARGCASMGTATAPGNAVDALLLNLKNTGKAITGLIDLVNTRTGG